MAPQGRYFQLVSKLSGHALGVTGAAAGGEVLLVTCERKETDDSQVWYEDKSTGTIRNKTNGLCLQQEDENRVRLRPYEPGHCGQQWTLKDGRVQQRGDPEKVLDISGGEKDVGASVCVWAHHGGENQLWEQVFLKPRFFYLKSVLSGRVLDIEGDCPDAGSLLCIWDQKPSSSSSSDAAASNQLWYEDENGFIRSRLNDFVIQLSDDKELAMHPFDVGRASSQSWVVHEGYVALEPMKTTVLDIVGSNPDNGARVCAWEAHGKPNQKWIVEFA